MVAARLACRPAAAESPREGRRKVLECGCPRCSQMLQSSEDHRPRFHIDAQAAFQGNEKLVFALMAMLADRALDFGDLDVVLVEFGNAAQRPIFGP